MEGEEKENKIKFSLKRQINIYIYMYMYMYMYIPHWTPSVALKQSNYSKEPLIKWVMSDP